MGKEARVFVFAGIPIFRFVFLLSILVSSDRPSVVVLFAPQLPKYPCGAQQIESILWFLSTMQF